MLFVYSTFVRYSSGINLLHSNDKSYQERNNIIHLVLRAYPFQDYPDICWPPPSSLLHLRVREQDVLVRVGHSRHLPVGQVHGVQPDCGELDWQCPPADGGAGVPPLPSAGLPQPLPSLQRALQSPVSAGPGTQEHRLLLSRPPITTQRQQDLPPPRSDRGTHFIFTISPIKCWELFIFEVKRCRSFKGSCIWIHWDCSFWNDKVSVSAKLNLSAPSYFIS